jgi:Domain of unknown function (DUF6249)
MHGDEFALFVIFGSIAGVICAALYLRFRARELQHKERLAALEKGTPLPDLYDEPQSPRSPTRIYLLRGMMWLFSGIAIVAFLSAIASFSRQPPRLESRLYRAQDLKKLGATDEQIRAAEEEPSRDGIPEGVALLGLVPIGIGLAYLIFYRVEKKNESTAVQRT